MVRDVRQEALLSARSLLAAADYSLFFLSLCGIEPPISLQTWYQVSKDTHVTLLLTLRKRLTQPPPHPDTVSGSSD